MRRHIRIIKANSSLRRAARIVIDAQILFISHYIAFWLRLNDDLDLFDPSVAVSALLFTAIGAIVFVMMGTGLRSWRFFGLRDVVEIVRDTAMTVGVYTLVGFMLSRLLIVPRSVPLIAFFIAVVGMTSVRIAYRAYFDGLAPNWLIGAPRRSSDAPTIRTLVLGATNWTNGFLTMLAANHENSIEVVGIVDDDPANRDRRIHGVRVIGAMEDLALLVSDFEDSDPPITQLVVTDPNVARGAMRRIFDMAKDAGLSVARLPQVESFVSKNGTDEVRLEPVQIADLLGRDPVTLDLQGISTLIKDKIVLVTGAGGSIGSELCRQILAREPSRLVLLDHSEYNLFRIEQDLAPAAEARGVQLVPKLMSVRDRERVNDAFRSERPELVFHAAAYKHVHLIEKNPLEGVWTNVVGTSIVGNAARDCGARAFIMVSTDKAVNPTSIMGMTKRAAECFCLALNDRLASAGDATRFITVRFGNVLGSSGSVVPIFEEQIRNGGPVTVTHEDVTRYFMTIPEAVQLVLQGSVYAVNSKERRSAVLVLDMGEPVKIVDLARRMIDIMRPWAEQETPIKIVGLRPGEKMHEELFDDDETQEMTASAGIFEAWSTYPNFDVVKTAVAEIESACLRSDQGAALDQVKSVISRQETRQDTRVRMQEGAR